MSRLATLDGAGLQAYSPSLVAHRIGDRCEQLSLTDIHAYVHRLDTDPAERGALAEMFSIKVSRFFRDPVAFEYLAEVVVPILLAHKAAAGGDVRVWSAGCANGEEPYSLAILLSGQRARPSPQGHATIIATDIDESALEFARRARYSGASLVDVRYGLLTSAFTPDGDQFRVVPEVCRLVHFSRHDLLCDRTVAPAESIFGTFDLIVCRNVLIYFGAEAQERICDRLYGSLADGGFLLLGRAEVPAEPWRHRLCPVTDCCRLYRKRSLHDHPFRETIP